MQYRAIGLIRGRYIASEDQFTRGTLESEDGSAINSVLLGRVTSLVKKHLDPEESHLWVVYPRTREHKKDLHVQVVGVWEPEKLNRPAEEEPEASDAAEASEEPEASSEAAAPDTEPSSDLQADAVEVSSGPADAADQAPAEPAEATPEAASKSAPEIVSVRKQGEETPDPDQEDDYFSVRGEVVYYSAEEGKVIVKILQAARRQSDADKFFKLTLKGILTGKTIGYFWDLSVKRQAEQLVIQSGQPIAIVPPKKKSAERAVRGGGDRRGSNTRPRGRKPPHQSADSSAKPIIKRKSASVQEE